MIHRMYAKSCFTLLLLAVLFTEAARADVSLPRIFSDHAVLRRAKDVPVWGKASPEEEVSVSMGGAVQQTKADAQGKWKVALDLEKIGAGPFELVAKGKNEVRVADVLVGEVWLASGQSNMELRLRDAIGSAQEIARSANPQLRFFRVGTAPKQMPADDVSGSWILADPATSGEFSAVAYFFSKNLQEALKAPVGVIQSAVGGSVCESWTSSEAMATVPELKPGHEKREEQVRLYSQRKREFSSAFGKWLEESGRTDRLSADKESFMGAAINPSEWTAVDVPGRVSKQGLADNGVVWLRKEVDIPAVAAHKDLTLKLGVIEGFEETYWNGHLLGVTSWKDFPGADFFRRYQVSGTMVQEGKNVLAIRIFSPAAPIEMRALPSAGGPLRGGWVGRTEFALPIWTEMEKVPTPPQFPPPDREIASRLFNGMIHPIIPYAISGIIWYQGENNTMRAAQYKRMFPLMIGDWRSRWGQGDIPFLFCQLPNSQGKKPTPEESAWAELREAQAQAATLPNVAGICTIDLGEEDVHPKDKVPVGERLARLALVRAYGKPGSAEGPRFKTMSVDRDKVRLSFEPHASALIAKPLPSIYAVRSSMNETAPLLRNSPESELEGFAVCGKDKKWIWAKAKIEGNDVVVWSDKVSDPVAVRYAWADNPTCNLYDAEGWPAFPFRTDNFEEMTKGATY